LLLTLAGDDRRGVTGDLLVFLGGENLHGASRVPRADRIGRRPVSGILEIEPRQIAAPTAASFSPMPPVKTIRSIPSSTATMAAICLRTE